MDGGRGLPGSARHRSVTEARGLDTPISLTLQRDGAALVISWPAGATGAVLETSASLSPGTWSAVPGVTGSSHRLTPANAAAFFRLR